MHFDQLQLCYFKTSDLISQIPLKPVEFLWCCFSHHTNRVMRMSGDVLPAATARWRHYTADKYKQAELTVAFIHSHVFLFLISIMVLLQ